MATSFESQPSPYPSTGAVVVPAEFLDRILDRLERMERKLEQLTAPVEQGPALVATAADTVDSWMRAAQARGVDVDGSLTAAGRLLEQVTAPETAQRVERLLNRLDAVETSLDMATDLPATIATVGDILDSWMKKAQENGVDLDATLRALTPTLTTLADPRTIEALGVLARRAPEAAEIAESVPQLVAAATDSLDGMMRRLTDRGTDLQAIGESVTVALSKLSELLNSSQYKALMNSGVLDPGTLDMVGKAGSALVHARMEACVETGVFGAFRATSNKDVQRAIGFAIKFAQSFGEELAQPDNLKHLAALGEPAPRPPSIQ